MCASFSVVSLSSEVLLTVSLCHNGKVDLFIAFFFFLLIWLVSLVCLFLGEGSNKMLRPGAGIISLNLTSRHPEEQSG